MAYPLDYDKENEIEVIDIEEILPLDLMNAMHIKKV